GAAARHVAATATSTAPHRRPTAAAPGCAADPDRRDQVVPAFAAQVSDTAREPGRGSLESDIAKDLDVRIAKETDRRNLIVHARRNGRNRAAARCAEVVAA